MIKKTVYSILLFFIFSVTIKAEICCSMQGGSTGEFNNDGYLICMDETISYDKSCIKIKEDSTKLKGCTDKNAKNYNEKATINDGNCLYYVYGCTDKEAHNYNKNADTDNGTCIAKIFGCINDKAYNYNREANTNDKSCKFKIIIENDEEILYKTIYKKDKNLESNEEIVIKKGHKGLNTVKYEITINEKGEELKKKKLETKIIIEASDKVIRQGTKNTFASFSIILYLTTFFIMILNAIDSKYDKLPKKLIFEEIYKQKKSKYLFLLLYYILVIPVFMDFCFIIKVIIKDLI